MNQSLINPNAWIDQFLSEFDKGWRNAEPSFVPAVDVVEGPDAYRLRVELPGVTKENVNVEVKENRLLLNGKKEAVVQGEEGAYRYVEARYGTFSRAFELPRNAKSDAIEAEFKDGVLQLRIPKVDEAKPKSIVIK